MLADVAVAVAEPVADFSRGAPIAGQAAHLGDNRIDVGQRVRPVL
jgi:hypothetical protein